MFLNDRSAIATCILAVGIVAVACGASSKSGRQVLPSECYEANRRYYTQIPDSVESYPLELAVSIRERIENALDSTSGGVDRNELITQSLRKAWLKDSSSVERALALVIAEDGYYSVAGGRVTLAALEAYRSYSGRAQPLLRMLSRPLNDSRRALALRAIHGRLDRHEEEVIFAYVCDAAWVMRTWRADSLQSKVAAGTRAEVIRAPEVIRIGTELLPSRYDSLSRILVDISTK